MNSKVRLAGIVLHNGRPRHGTRGTDRPAQTLTTHAAGWTFRSNTTPRRLLAVSQAGVLQGFPPDYPWRGTKRRKFAQIGNAVCPLVAAAVLAEATRPSRTMGVRS